MIIRALCTKLKVESYGRTYIFFLCPLSLELYVRISIAHLRKYHAVRHITCAVSANIDLHKNPLIHRRRDDGPRSSAEPPPFRHAKGVPPFPLSGKSTPQSSAKPSGRRLIFFNFQLPNGGEWCSLPQPVTETDRRVLKRT